MKTVTIPGGVVTLREKHERSIRQKRLVETHEIAAATGIIKLPDDPSKLKNLRLDTIPDLSSAEVQAIFDLTNAVIVAALVSWSREDPLPTMTTIEDLEPEVYEALSDAVSGLGKSEDVDFEPPNPNGKEFADSPTEPSGNSETALRADQEPQSVEQSQSAGGSTPSAVSSPA